MSATPNDAPFAGASALVLGAGASIGLAAARLLARDGASVLLVGLDGTQLDAAAAHVRAAAAPGSVVRTLVAEATDEHDVVAAVAAARDLPGRFAACVCAVGRTTMAPILGYTAEEWRDELRVNVESAFLALKHAGRALAENGGGTFVAVSSHAGERSMRHLASYCSSKAGLEMLIRVAADELGAFGVRVNAVRPGLTRRDRASPIFGHDGLESAYLERTPLGRNGTPEDSAQAIRFLAGPESSWVTGQCLTVDGGLTLRGAPDLEAAARRMRGDALFDAHAAPEVASPATVGGRLDGAHALVTGGGSSIGFGTARVLARSGARVTISGRDETRLRTAVDVLAAEGLQVAWHTADVTVDDEVARAVCAAADDAGRLDICVASAGTAVMSPIVDLTLERFRVPFELNVVGSYLTLKHAATAMGPGGSFVAISSESAIVTLRNLGAYCASKAALDMLVRVAADELGGRAIRVNSVRPGLTRREAESPIFGDEEAMARYREKTPLVRTGLVDDSAYAVRYFAGPESRWTTGQLLTVDGGLEVRGAPNLDNVVRRFQLLVEGRP